MREMVEAALERYLLALAGPGATGEVFVVRDSLVHTHGHEIVAVLISPSTSPHDMIMLCTTRQCSAWLDRWVLAQEVFASWANVNAVSTATAGEAS